MRVALLPVLLALLPLVGCRPAPPCPQGCSAAGLTVIQSDYLGAPCPDSSPCADYLDLLPPTPPDPASVTALEAQVASLHAAHEANTPLPGPPLEGEALRAAIVEGLALGPLLDGLDARPLRISQATRAAAPFGEEILLRVHDPLVGAFNLLLLRPAGEGPFPGVVALPGHADPPSYHRDRYLGAELARAGFVVAIVQLRNHGGDAVESELSRRMLVAGRPVLGLHVYEALLARKILRWHADVVPDRVAVMGHSGGAEVAALAARIDPGFAALVVDHQSAYLGVLADGRWLDDTVPALHRIHPSINDLGTSETPVYQDAYEYPRGADPVVAFLRGAGRSR